MVRHLWRLTLSEPLSVPPEMPGVVWRPVSASDTEMLAELMLGAYRGGVDDGGETLDDARAEVARFFDPAGAYGAPDLAASVAGVANGEMVTACLIGRYPRERPAPLVTFIMTAPGHKQRGLARGALVRSLRALAGEGHVNAAVTAGNTPSERLLASLGFVQRATG